MADYIEDGYVLFDGEDADGNPRKIRVNVTGGSLDMSATSVSGDSGTILFDGVDPSGNRVPITVNVVNGAIEVA